MTPTETSRVLRMLCTAYPEYRMTQPSAVLWAKYLEPFEAIDVEEAADQWIVTNERFPKVANLVEGIRITMKHRHEADAERRGLNDGPQTPSGRDQVAQLLTVTRSVLQTQSSRTHHHGGPDPCGVCGGMRR